MAPPDNACSRRIASKIAVPPRLTRSLCRIRLETNAASKKMTSAGRDKFRRDVGGDVEGVEITVKGVRCRGATTSTMRVGDPFSSYFPVADSARLQLACYLARRADY